MKTCNNFAPAGFESMCIKEERRVEGRGREGET